MNLRLTVYHRLPCKDSGELRFSIQEGTRTQPGGNASHEITGAKKREKVHGRSVRSEVDRGDGEAGAVAASDSSVEMPSTTCLTICMSGIDPPRLIIDNK